MRRATGGWRRLSGTELDVDTSVKTKHNRTDEGCFTAGPRDVLLFSGGIRMREITVEASADRVRDVTDFVNAFLDRLDCPEETRIQIDVAVDEIFGNIARYVYAPGTGTAAVRVDAEDDPPCVVLMFADRGVPFDPLGEEAPDLSLPMRQRKIGGTGAVHRQGNGLQRRP